MSLNSKYERLYRDQADVCGKPFPEFIEFAKSHSDSAGTVLDLGCGQGRDAILFARHGFSVLGVDVAPTGIEQMVEAGKSERLSLDGVVCDVRTFEPELSFDVVVIDRTLHMLKKVDERLEVIKRSADCLADGGHILIADEKSNIPAFKDWFKQDHRKWSFHPNMKPSFCFVQCR